MKGVKIDNKDLDRLIYPLLASYKYDGIRCLVPDGYAKTSKMKDIPNNFIKDFLSDNKYVDLDGELVIGNPTAKGSFNKTQSGVMSRDGQPDFTFYVFDLVRQGYKYGIRRRLLHNRMGYPRLFIVKQHLIHNKKELMKFECKALAKGYEGIMLRWEDADYKYGKATLNQMMLLKRKPFNDAEGRIVEVYEQNQNNNSSKENELGLFKRSKAKDGMEGKDTLGGFILETQWGLLRCATGLGLTKNKRLSLWKDKDNLLGKYITFKYLPVGMKDKPRHPIFLRFRDERDIS